MVDEFRNIGRIHDFDCWNSSSHKIIILEVNVEALAVDAVNRIDKAIKESVLMI